MRELVCDKRKSDKFAEKANCMKNNLIDDWSLVN